jgi:hypothetical protein
MLQLAGQSFLESWKSPAQRKSQPEQFARHMPATLRCHAVFDPTGVLSYLVDFIRRFFSERRKRGQDPLDGRVLHHGYALHGLAPPNYDAIRLALDASHFKVALRRAVRTVFRRHLPWDKVRVTVTQ